MLTLLQKNWGKTLDKNFLNYTSEYHGPHVIKCICVRRLCVETCFKNTDTKLGRCVYQGLLRANKMLIRYYFLEYLLIQELSRDEEQ